MRGNELTSAGSGIGVQFGTDAPPCPVRVDEVEILDNTITHHAKPLLVLCDVGTYIDSGN